MGARYSASRVSTFESCKLKYSLQYQRGYYAEDTQQNVLTRKGTAFHEFAENYTPDWTAEKVEEQRKFYEEQFSLPEEFSLVQPVARFVEWYHQVIQPIIDEGGKVQNEIQFDFYLDNNHFTGKLDILAIDKDGVFWIIDHKTGRSTNTSYYKKQLLLYAWALHYQFKVPREEMTKRIKASIFFPFANPDEEDVRKVFKGIRFGDKHLDEVKDEFNTTIHRIESKQWEPEANLSRMCDFCPFAGKKEYCELSAKAGIHPTRGVKIKQRSWAIKAGIT